MKRVFMLLSAFTALLAVSTSPVQAAPQILAVMASLGPQQMDCSGAICTTSLSSYCLQRERGVPSTGQAYLPASDDHFSLVVVAEDGTEKSVPASGHVTFRSVRGYSSVNAVIGKDALAKLGGVSAKFVAASRAVLVPAPEAGDPNPITEREMAFATQSLRQHGSEVVDAQPDAEAAALVNRMAATIVPRQAVNPESLEQLWHDVIKGLGPSHPANSEGIRRARDIYDWCQTHSSYHSMAGIKSCLEFRHDGQIMKLNTDYWESQPGY